MKKFLVLIFLFAVALACSNNSSNSSENSNSNTKSEVDDLKGVGEIKHVDLNDPLDETMIQRGLAIYNMKCAACHKLTDKRLVGPGWKGVTERRKPEWIMNMTTNVEIMLDEDPQARKLLQECLVRMPNQNLSIGDARDVLEFMYNNDSKEES